jgi:hypothetical protein
MTIDRRLLTYAFVSQNIFNQNDILFGLLPFFKPIFQEWAGRTFDPDELAARVRSLYRWPVNPDIVELAVPRFVSAGWLKRVVERQDLTAYTYQLPPRSELNEEQERAASHDLSRISELFAEFNRKLPSLLSLSYNDSDLQEMLLTWLVEKRAFDKASILQAMDDTPRLDRSQALSVSERRSRDKLPYFTEENYLCARFVKHLHFTNSTLFESLVKIAGVALATEVALDIHSPSTANRPTSPLTVFIDAPLVMTLLGLSGRQRFENANYIFSHLKNLNHSLHIFGHSCDEIRDNLKGLLNTPAHKRYGPTADAMRQGEVKEEYATAVLTNTEYFCSNLGITVVEYDLSLFPNEHGFFPGDIITEFASSLPWDVPGLYVDKGIAKDRDARSICYITRRRRGKMSTDVFRSQCVLLTQNSVLCRMATEFLVEKDLLRSGQIGPAVHQRHMAALLFLTMGSQEKAELSRRELLESCEAVVNASPEVIEGAKKRLKDVRPENADQIEALLSQPRSIQLLQDLTLGSQTVVGRSDMDLVYDALRQSVAEEETKKAKLEITAIKKVAKSDKQVLTAALAENQVTLQTYERRTRGSRAKRSCAA